VKALSIWTKLFLGLVLFSLAGTLLKATAGVDPGPIAPVASLLTIAIGFIALTQSAHWGYALAVLFVGASAEICGLYTGLPFGRYAYTERWWPIVELPDDHYFPILVPFAWFLVAGGCALAFKAVGKSSMILAPVIATLIDFLMEPVMVKVLGYWRWIEPGPLPGGAPWLNVAGWFLTSLIAAWILSKSKAKGSEDPVWVLVGFVLLITGLWLISERVPA